jgi:hypothetical protein
MPPGVSSCAAAISAPRALTSWMPSSGESAPATTAAVYSPSEWPAAKSGRMPDSRARSAVASATQNSAGWAALVAVSSSIGPSRQSRLIGSPDAASACSR